MSEFFGSRLYLNSVWIRAVCWIWIQIQGFLTNIWKNLQTKNKNKDEKAPKYFILGLYE